MRGLLFLFVLAGAWLVASLSPVRAMPPPMAMCKNAAIAAADAHGIPREVMVAITLVETRTKRDGHSGPWPWTVNVAGKGRWFDSRAAALIHAQAALSRGQTSFDVGCFQLNYRWHGMNFGSIDQMFEPGPSGDYAARFLKSLHGETGDWIKAAGLYHSRTAKHAQRYRGLVAQTVTAMGGRAPSPIEGVAAPSPVQQPVTNWPLAGGLAQGGGLGQTAGSVGLGMLRRAGGALIGGGG